MPMISPVLTILPEELQALIPAGFQPLPDRGPDHGCFGCSPTNTCGLRMRFFSDGKSILSPLRVPAHLCGWNRLVHGGVLATILDEAMSWAAIRLLHRIILTKSMQLSFLRPVWVETLLVARAHVAETSSAREARLTAAIHDANGQTLTRADGCLALFSAEAAQRKGIMTKTAIEKILPLLEP